MSMFLCVRRAGEREEGRGQVLKLRRQEESRVKTIVDLGVERREKREERREKREETPLKRFLFFFVLGCCGCCYCVRSFLFFFIPSLGVRMFPCVK